MSVVTYKRSFLGWFELLCRERKTGPSGLVPAAPVGAGLPCAANRCETWRGGKARSLTALTSLRALHIEQHRERQQRLGRTSTESAQIASFARRKVGTCGQPDTTRARPERGFGKSSACESNGTLLGSSVNRIRVW